MWQDTTEGDGGADQGVELLVTTDGELQVAGRNTLDLEILGSVLGEGEHVSISSMAWESQAATEQTLLCNQAPRGGRGMTHACEFEDLGSQVLEDSGNVDGSLGANTHLVLGVGLEETLDTTAGELKGIQVSDQIIARDCECAPIRRQVVSRVRCHPRDPAQSRVDR